jgi:simple sugar transport system permease protein
MLGRSIYAIGGDRKSALRVGLNVRLAEEFVYSFMGLLAGIAGVIQALLVQTVAPNSIVGKELNIIVAVVLGGASLTGGKGSVFGAFLGLVLLAIVKNGMTLMAIPPVWYEFFVGCVILLSVGITSYKHTPTGFTTFLMGSNPIATSFSGISNGKTIMLTYLVSGLLSGAAGIVMMSRFNSAKAGYGESYLLVTVLACVLGGIKSEGGFGDVAGLMLSLVILQVLSSGLNLLGISSFLTLALWGAIMIAVMLMQFFFSRKQSIV